MNKDCETSNGRSERLFFSLLSVPKNTHHDERLALEGHGSAPGAREELELRSHGHLVRRERRS